VTERTRHLLLWVSGVACVLAFVVSATGGVSFSVFGVSFRSHQPWGLLVVCLTAAGLALVRAGQDKVASDLVSAWNHRASASRWVTAMAALCVLAVGLVWNTRSAGGSDPYGYVSQAVLWTQGDVSVEQPMALSVPWPEADWTFSPLGYRPSLSPGSIVPTYPPGLPLTMAPFVAVGGIEAAFLVVPLLGALAVWLTFVVGRRLADPAVGAAAAALLACSPIFLYQLVQPMSDVPVTAWWLAAIALALAQRQAWSGLATSIAVLTRPNLAPLGLAPLIWLALEAFARRRSWRDAILTAATFCAAALPASLFLMWLNVTWYGSPLANGYGKASNLFSLETIAPNLEHYTRWLTESHSPAVLIGLLAPVAAWWSTRRLSGASLPGPRVRSAVFSVTFVLLVLGCYLPYFVFQEWWYLRFLLPGLAVLFVLFATVIWVVVGHAPVCSRVPIFVVLVCLLAVLFVRTARERDVFSLHTLESRYVDAGRFAAQYLPERAVLFAVQESGSLRLYGDRLTLRWDWLNPSWFERAVDDLRQRGVVPYFVVEVWEEAQFKDRFGPVSGLGQLDWPPAAEVGRPVRVRFYDPRDRARFQRGLPIAPLTPIGRQQP
jgi:hypothetical protein